ncbi:MAG: hypothetical protein DRI57_05615 [Deltaproteobacteria bacterium]|nr:MAG: hypothetical protein DRI57_05615 [Deltaproteobacteria bacterium]
MQPYYCSGPNIRWRCILYPAGVDDELVKKMARAGCCEVSLGFESGSEKMLGNFNFLLFTFYF